MSGVATSSRIATPGPTDPTSPSKPNGPPETVKNITATRGPSLSPPAFMRAGFVTARNLQVMMFDVAVVGSGPGGATAALELARQGLTVVLLEKERLIAADGAMSDVARLAGWIDGRHLIPALEHEIQVDDATFERCARAPRFDVGIVPHGYAWVFPKAAHLSVGVLSMRRGAGHLHRDLEQYLKALDIVPRAVERHRFVIPVRPRAEGFARHRVLLVGDAAGFADPVTAEGV